MRRGWSSVARACGWWVGVGAAGLGASCFSERRPTVPEGVTCDLPIELIDQGHTVIAIRDFTFVPDSVSVRPGTTVAWVSCERPEIDPHTSTSDEGIWGSELLAPGDTFTRTFDEAGTFSYHCVPHPFMTARIVVE